MLTTDSDGRALLTTAVDAEQDEAVLIFEHNYFYLKPEHIPRRLGEDLNAAAESVLPTSIWCSITIMARSCLVFEI